MRHGKEWIAELMQEVAPVNSESVLIVYEPVLRKVRETKDLTEYEEVDTPIGIILGVPEWLPSEKLERWVKKVYSKCSRIRKAKVYNVEGVVEKYYYVSTWERFLFELHAENVI